MDSGKADSSSSPVLRFAQSQQFTLRVRIECFLLDGRNFADRSQARNRDTIARVRLGLRGRLPGYRERKSEEFRVGPHGSPRPLRRLSEPDFQEFPRPLNPVRLRTRFYNREYATLPPRDTKEDFEEKWPPS